MMRKCTILIARLDELFVFSLGNLIKAYVSKEIQYLSICTIQLHQRTI